MCLRNSNENEITCGMSDDKDGICIKENKSFYIRQNEKMEIKYEQQRGTSYSLLCNF